MFDRLVHILAPNPIFHSPRKQQRHVKFQLAAFLVRYGQQGSDTLDVAAKLSIGHGTVYNYCKRVSRAIRELGPQYLQWGNQDRKAVVSTAIEAQSGFPKCLGSGDGSQIRIGEEPTVDGEQFRCRKKFISVSIHESLQFFILSINNILRQTFKQLLTMKEDLHHMSLVGQVQSQTLRSSKTLTFG
jgi:hypothetical protein